MTTIMQAVQFGLNCTGGAALITGLFMFAKGKGDTRLALKQLEASQHQADRDDTRDDNKDVRDSYKELVSSLRSDRDEWRERAQKAEADLLNLRQDTQAAREAWSVMGAAWDKTMMREGKAGEQE